MISFTDQQMTRLQDVAQLLRNTKTRHIFIRSVANRIIETSQRRLVCPNDFELEDAIRFCSSCYGLSAPSQPLARSKTKHLGHTE